MAYAFASFYVLTIPIPGAFFAKRNWLMAAIVWFYVVTGGLKASTWVGVLQFGY